MYTCIFMYIKDEEQLETDEDEEHEFDDMDVVPP